MKPLSARQVLNLWLFSKIGTPTRVKPIGGESDFEVDGPATMLLASLRVESVSRFREKRLRAWLDFQGVDERTMLYCNRFTERLEQSLNGSPLYPVERGEAAKTKVPTYTLRELAEKLDPAKPLNPKTVMIFMNEKGFTLPGVFRFGGHWSVVSIDNLKRLYESTRLDVSEETLNLRYWAMVVRLVLILRAGPKRLNDERREKIA